MEETKHKIKIKRHSRRNWHAAAACLLSIALLVCLSAQYLSFVSKTIYAESTEHLEELLHKSNNMLSMIVKKNTSYLHVWNGFLSSDPDDASTQAYLESAQQQLGFAEFYFLSYDGNYMTPSGKTGYLGLQSNLDEQLSDQKDVVLNTALPGQDPMLVFICPETKGIYRGFAYDAIAISHYNNVVMKAVDDSAFGGTASSFVIYPDGQVVIENISEGSESIYNFVAILQEYSDLTEAQIQELTDDFAQGITGNREVTLDGTRYYMVYESTGIQNWILVGLVPRDSVNAAMNQLWQRTMQIVALVVLSIAAMVLLMVMHRGRTKLRRQNTAILYRDVLFEKLSQNVDDVFLLKAPGGLCQPEHRTAAGPDDEERAQEYRHAGPAVPGGFPRPHQKLSGRACLRRPARMGHGVCPSENRGASLVPCGCHGQRGRGPNQAHSGSV